jgi:plasmid stabilization system protein ParE
MNVKWTIPAAEQLDQAYNYIAESNSDAAEEVAQHVIDTTEMLGKHPGAGRNGRVAGTREFFVPDTPFVIAYAVKDEVVWILAMYHGARKWPKAF